MERVDFLSHFFLLELMTSEESFYMVETHLTVEKQAKRIPDTTVETTHAHNNSPLHNNHHPAKSKSQIPDSYYRKHPFGHPFEGAMLLKINEISILFSQSLTNRKLCERRCACRSGTALLLALGRALIQGLYLIVSVGQVPAIISN